MIGWRRGRRDAAQLHGVTATADFRKRALEEGTLWLLRSGCVSAVRRLLVENGRLVEIEGRLNSANTLRARWSSVPTTVGSGCLPS